jgi:hypothetical protein
MNSIQDVSFPDLGGDLSSYAPNIQASAILKAKQAIEEAVGHPVHCFRSGSWSCDPAVENGCVSAGFQSISNHESTYLLPSGMWQIATMTVFDVLREPRMLWRSLKGDSKHKLFPLFSHPMILFDHATGQSREKMLQEFFRQLDEFRLNYPDIHFMTTTAASSQLQYKPPSILIRIAAGTFGILLILGCLILSLHCRGANPTWRTKRVDKV